MTTTETVNRAEESEIDNWSFSLQEAPCAFKKNKCVHQLDSQPRDLP